MEALGVGGPSVFVLLSLVNKETALGLVIGQNLCRQGARTKCWEVDQSQADAMVLLPEMDAG